MRCSTKLALFSTAAAVTITRADIAMSAVSSEGRLCVKDAVQVEWTISEWSHENELVWIEVHDLSISSTTSTTGTSTQSRTVARFNVFQYGPDDGDMSSPLEVVETVPKSIERLHSVIHSLHDGPFKTPEIRTVYHASQRY